jgi:dolichyl-phosphate-mannose-protein mannosyltransferase
MRLQAPVSKKLQRALLFCAAANLAVVAWDLATGGIYIAVGRLVFSSWEIAKPVRYAVVCLAVAIWLRDRRAATTSWDLLPRFSSAAALAVVFVSVIVAGLLGIRAAGGADAYGYVSQAQLWADGRLVAPDPLAPLANEVGRAVTPLGYTIAPAYDALVPTYPPGLPLLMAAAQLAAGPRAVYAIVPLLGGLTIWLTYLVGARMADERTGLVAALLIAFSPLFMFHTFEPMSDIPATAWWTAAWAMSLLPGAAGAFGAGVAVAAAVLTRPNLAPLALVLIPVIVASPPRWTRLGLFAGAGAAGCAAIGVFNAVLYGSPLTSGYGPLDQFFDREHLGPNLTRYTRWMFELHTPVLLLAALAPLARRSRVVLWMWVFCLAVGLSYAFYLVFDNWPFARFLLPSLPLLFVLVSIVLLRAIGALPSALRGAALLSVCASLVGWYVTVADRHGIFAVQRAEQRYATIGRTLGEILPRRAVVLSMIQSGSVRWHGHRLTLRWDFIPPDRFDSTIALLRDRGYVPYILLEDWEEPLFRQQFAQTNAFGRIDWPPAMEYQGAGHVRLYCVADRSRHLSGEPVITVPVPAP